MTNDDLTILSAPKCGGTHIEATFFDNRRRIASREGFGESTFTIFVIREPMDRLVSNYCFWTQGGRTAPNRGKLYSKRNRYLTFKEYCKRVCHERFEAHTKDQHLRLRKTRHVDFFLPLEDLDEAIITLCSKMPGIEAKTPPEHLNKSNREKDWFEGEDALRELCEESYAVDMALYGIAKNYPITLEESIDRWQSLK